MNKKTTLPILLIAALLVLPLSWASATVSLQFNNSTNNQVGGSPGTVAVNAGSTFILSLQLFSTAEPTNAVDYWLTQFSGPMAGVFSITNRDYTSSLFPDPSAGLAQVTDTADTGSNTVSQGGAGRTPDGIADNRLNPRNAWNLGSSKADTGTNNPAGTLQIANFTIAVLPGATLGTYQIQSFDYAGFGWSSTTAIDQPFAAQAAININVVPEPSTWMLLGAGVVGLVALNRFRGRRIS